uniref:Armadillo repeat-containing protein 6 n=1 Tax=Lygus hesperus TaxID=30085 RepID=A0A0A9YD67_LYGHE
MERKVNQADFNEVVLENIVEFDMEEAEAIDSAVSQLEAQGVNLQNVIFDKEVIHGVDEISKFHKLYSNVEVIDDEEIEAFLASLDSASTLADKDTKYKLYAGRMDVHSIVINVLKCKMEEPTLVERILRNLTTIVSGYPDLVDESTISFIINLFNKYLSDDCIMLSTANLILKSLTKHENNKQNFFTNEKSRPILKTLIETEKYQLVKIGCDLITCLCQDDDIRVEISAAHTRATSLAEDFLSQCYTKLKSQHDVPLTNAIIRAVTSMSVTNQLVSNLYELDPEFKILIELFNDFRKEVDILHNVTKLLVALSGNDVCKSAMAPLIPLVVNGIDTFMASRKVVQSLFLVISSLSLRSKPNALAFIELNAVDKIVQAMKVHAHIKLRRYGCMALRNIASSSKITQPFDESGVVELINSLLINRSNEFLEEDCKSVLIALGAPVSLTERWTGKRGDVVGDNQKLLDR